MRLITCDKVIGSYEKGERKEQDLYTSGTQVVTEALFVISGYYMTNITNRIL